MSVKQKALSSSGRKRATGVSSTAVEADNSASGSGSSSDYLQAIIDCLEDELMVIGRDYRIIEANRTVLSKHGKLRHEVIGQHCYEISHGLPELCRPPHHECPIKAAWETGKSARVTHLHVHDVKGGKQERFLDIIASPIADRQGTITAVVELMRDVTETKELESKVAKTHQDLLALNTIAGVVSQSLELDTILESALDKTLELMQQSAGGILLLDEESQTLSYRIYRGLSKKYAKGIRLKLGEGIAGRVAQTGEPILTDDVLVDSRAAHPDLVTREGIRAFVSVPLRSKDRVLGVLNIASHESRKFSPEDTQLLSGIAAQIAIAIENARLHQEVRHKEEIRGELLQEIFSIQEEERKRIARELHDETSQMLAGLAASLEAAIGMLPSGLNKPKAMLRNAQNLSINALDEIHKLIYDLRPTLLDDLGLVAAIGWLVDNNLKTSGVKADFKAVGRARRLDAQVETTFFRVIQEAFNNIVRHARAKNTRINLYFRKTAIEVRITDDGRGFDVEEAISSKDRPRGLGLLGMKERVELVNGILNISSHAGSGTEIDIKIPVNQEVSNE